MAASNDIDKNRELSWLVAAVLFIGFLAFIGGYFLGVRHGARSFMDAHQEELIESALDGTTTMVLSEQEQPRAQSGEVGMPSTSTQIPVVEPLTQRFWAIVTIVDSYAQAINLMEQATKVGIVVRIKKTSNMLPRGKKKFLYQLVTPRYASQEQLERALETLKTAPLLAKYMSVPTRGPIVRNAAL